MRTISSSESSLLTARANGTGRIRTRWRVRIRDNSGNYQTYTSQLIKCRIRRNKDEPVATAELVLAYRVGTNLSPYANAQKPIDLSRDIQIEAAYLDANNSPITWHLRFDGFIQSIEPRGKYEMLITARDRFGILMDRYTEGERTYGGGSRVDTVIQTVLNDWAPGVTLFVPVAPASSDTVANEKFSEQPVGQIIRKLALRKAWDISYRFDSGTGTYRLTFIDPARSNTTPTYTFQARMFAALNDWGVDRTMIRNKIEVVYGSGTGRGSVTVSDSASIAAHGTLYMRIGEDQGLHLQNSTQATQVANAVLSDLSTPLIEARYKVPYFPFAELNDVFSFAATNYEYDTAQTLAVVGIEEEMQADADGTQAFTTLTVRGKPLGGRTVWTDIGNVTPAPDPGTVSAPDAPTGLAGNFTTADAVLAWNPVVNAVAYEVVVKNTTGGATRRTEVVAEPSYQYTIEKHRADGTLTPNLTFEVRAIRSSSEGQVYSSPATLALSNAAPSAPASVTLVGEPLRYRASVPEPTFGDYLRTEWQSDDNSGFTSPTLAASGPDWQGVQIGLEAGASTTFVRARYVDVFGQASGWTTASSAGVLVGAAHIAAGAVGVAQFASSLSPVQLYNSATLPTLPNSSYPQGTIIYNVNATNRGLWQNKNNSSWERLIDGATDIQADSITAGQIAAGAITASELAAGAATIEKLAIGSFANNTLNPGFEDSTGGWHFQTGWVRTNADKRLGNWSAAFTGYIAAAKNNYSIPVVPGDPVFAEGWMMGVSGANGQAFIRITWLDASLAEISYSNSDTAPSNNQWHRLTVYGVAPANAARARFDFVASYRTTGTWYADDALLIPAQRGRLIVDGSIEAVKLTALELNAIQGTFGGGNNKSAIDNRGLRVYDNTSALRVAVGDVGGLSNPIGGTLPTGTYGIWLGQNSFFNGQVSALALARTMRDVIEVQEKFTGLSISANGQWVLAEYNFSEVNLLMQYLPYKFCVVSVMRDYEPFNDVDVELRHENDNSLIWSSSSSYSRYNTFDFSTAERNYSTRLDQFTPRKMRVILKNKTGFTLVGVWGVIIIRMVRWQDDGTWNGYY